MPPSELVLLPRTGVDLCQSLEDEAEGAIPFDDQRDGPAVTDLLGGPYPSGASTGPGPVPDLGEASGEAVSAKKVLKASGSAPLRVDVVADMDDVESGSPLFVLCTCGRGGRGALAFDGGSMPLPCARGDCVYGEAMPGDMTRGERPRAPPPAPLPLLLPAGLPAPTIG